MSAFDFFGRVFRTNLCNEKYVLPFLLFSGVGGIIILYECCHQYEECWFGNFNSSLFSAFVQINITLVAIALAVFSFLLSFHKDYNEIHYSKVRVSILLITTFGIGATILDCLALALKNPSISLFACSAEVLFLILFMIPVYTILGRKWKDGINAGEEQRKEYVERIRHLKHLFSSLCETLDQQMEYISFYEQIDSCLVFSKEERKYLKKLKNRIESINTGGYIRNIETEISHLQGLLQKVASDQPIDKGPSLSV